MCFSSMTIFSSFIKWRQFKNLNRNHLRRVVFCRYHLWANDLALPNAVAELRFISFQSCANLFEAASWYPGIAFRRLYLHLLSLVKVDQVSMSELPLQRQLRIFPTNFFPQQKEDIITHRHFGHWPIWHEIVQWPKICKCW